jgi:hypothetical protein
MEGNYKRIVWEEYREFLIKIGYTEEQIENVKQIREDSNYKEMSQEQFRFLHLNGIIKRTRKLKKLRTYLVSPEGKVLYLEHHFKAWNFCGYFLND